MDTGITTDAVCNSLWGGDCPKGEKIRVDITGVWGASHEDVFGVGRLDSLESSLSEAGFLLRFDGKHWKSVESKEPLLDDPSGVFGFGTDEFIIVGPGIELVLGGSRILMRTESDAEFHWRVHSGLEWYHSEAQLIGVWGSSSSDIFAAGVANGRIHSAGDIGLILHYDGVGPWREMKTGTRVLLHGIWGASPTDVYAVGERGTILHYEGKSCRPIRKTP
jgi:hypothetical protein